MKKNILITRLGAWAEIEEALVLVVESDEELTEEQILADIREATTKWAVETRNGKATYRYAAQDMNIGDLDGYWEELSQRCRLIENLSAISVQIPKKWHWDTFLINEK